MAASMITPRDDRRQLYRQVPDTAFDVSSAFAGRRLCSTELWEVAKAGQLVVMRATVPCLPPGRLRAACRILRVRCDARQRLRRLWQRMRSTRWGIARECGVDPELDRSERCAICGQEVRIEQPFCHLYEQGRRITLCCPTCVSVYLERGGTVQPWRPNMAKAAA